MCSVSRMSTEILHCILQLKLNRLRYSSCFFLYRLSNYLALTISFLPIYIGSPHHNDINRIALNVSSLDKIIGYERILKIGNRIYGYGRLVKCRQPYYLHQAFFVHTG